GGGFGRPRLPASGVVGDFHFDTERRVPLLLLDVDARGPGEPAVFRLEGAYRAERAHLGHPRGVDDIDAVDVLELLGDCPREGRAADHHALEVTELAAGCFQM